MKIAIIHSFYSSAIPSGENVVVRAQVEALRAAGHEVRLIARSTDELDSGRLYTLRSATTVATGIGPSPAAELVEFAPDVVHVHNLFPNWGTRWLQGWPGPVVTTLHNYRTVCAAGTLFRSGQACHECADRNSLQAVRHRCYRGSAIASVPLAISTAGRADRHPVIARSDALIALSDIAAQELRRCGLLRSIEVLPNFVPRPPVADITDPPTARWVYVGRISREKGILELAEHWPAGHKLDVYGSGPASDDLQQRAAPGVRYHGPLAHDDVAGVLRDSRGLVFPSLWTEGSPMIYAEALSVGRPVLAHAANAVGADVISHGPGLAFRTFHELRSVIEDAELHWAALCQRAVDRFESAFEQTAWVSRIESIYDEAITARAAP